MSAGTFTGEIVDGRRAGKEKTGEEQLTIRDYTMRNNDA